jgi:hypothetical protein
MAQDFYPRVPARLVKDGSLSDHARFLWITISTFADGRSHESHVTSKGLRATLGWGRAKLERAERELFTRGLLLVRWQRGASGRFERRIFQVVQPATGKPVRQK